MMNMWCPKCVFYFDKFKKFFYEKKKVATLGYSIKNEDKWQKITEEELKPSWTQAVDLIDYKEKMRRQTISNYSR